MGKLRSVPWVPRIRGLAVVLVMPGWWQMAVAEPPGEKDHEELRAIMELVAAAFNEGRLEDLQPVVTDPFVFTTSDQVALTSIAQIKAHYEKTFHADDSPLTGLVISPEATVPTRFIDDHNGFCYGTLAESYTLRSGGTIEVMASWTANVTKVDGTWKVSSAHVGVHFMNNPVVDLIKKTLIRRCLTGGVIIGALLGAVLAIVLRRRKAGAEAVS